MKWIARQTKWIMLISGILTSSIFYVAIFPHQAMISSFGQDLPGPLAELMVRSWAMMVGFLGVMLIYAAFKPPLQRFTLTFAALTKGCFVLFLLTVGKDYLGQQFGMAVYADGLEVVLYVLCLIGYQSKTVEATRTIA